MYYRDIIGNVTTSHVRRERDAVAVELAGYPSVQYSVDTIVTHMSDMATVRYELGYASAIAVILFGMMAITRFIIGKALNTVSR